MANDLELALRIRADMRQAVFEIRRFKNEILGTGKEGARAGKDLNAAFGALNMRPFRDIQREINLTRAGYRRLADSGRLSARELSVAHRQMRSRISELRRELRGGVAESSRMGRAVAGVVSIYAASRLARNVAAVTDQYTQLEGRLRLVTDSETELAAVEQALFDAAQRTRTEYASTVELYARVARNADNLALSQQELLTLTEAVNQSIQIGGSTSQEAAAGVIQFAQALASGELRGDELRSVLENMPRLTQALADGLETDIGGLRRMSEAGELTAERVTRALLSQSETIDREYGSMERTIGQAMTQLQNDVNRAIKDTDVSPVIDAIDELREMVKDPAFRQGMTDLLSGAARLVALAGEGAAAFGGLGRAIGTTAAQLATGRFSLGPFADDIRKAEVELVTLERRLATSQGGGLLHRWLYGSREDLEQQIEATRVRLEQLRQWQDEMRQQGLPLPAEDAPAKPVPAPPSAPTGQNDEFAKARDDIERHIALLSRESAEQQILWEVENGRYKDLAQSEKEALIALSQRLDAAKSQADYDAELERAARAVRDTLDPMEPLRREMQQLDELLENGKISWDEWSDATLNVQQRMDEMNGKMSETEANLDQFAVQAARNLQSAFADFLFDPFEEGLKGMLRGFVDIIRRMAAEALAAKLAQSLFGDIGSGSLGGVIGGALASVFHDGGVVGAGGGNRTVSPLVFAGAARYHSGGIAGLAPDEVPAILRRNEEVLTENDPRNRLNGGGAFGAQQSMRFVLVDDRANIGDYLSSSEGEKVQIETIRRNAMTIRTILS